MKQFQRGTLYAVVAYTLWGVFPLYFTVLQPATPMEILAMRIIWSLLVCLLAVAALGRGSALRAARPPQVRRLTIAGVLLAVNWLTFVYAVTTGQVVEASLGYFINPLVSVALGVLVLHERLSRAQGAALGIAAVAVALLTVNYGRPPWIALTLALSFAFYGLLKKQVGLGSLESLTVETGLLAAPALGWAAWAAAHGSLTFAGFGAGHALLLGGLGVITTVPLLLFGAAATRIPLTWVGMLQYIAPVLQFAIGVVLLGEQMPAARWAGFALVWLALVLFTVDILVRSRAGPGGPGAPASGSPGRQRGT